MTILLKVYDGFFYRPSIEIPEPIRILSFNDRAKCEEITRDLHAEVFYNGEYEGLLDTVYRAFSLHCTPVRVKGTDGNWVVEIVRI